MCVCSFRGARVAFLVAKMFTVSLEVNSERERYWLGEIMRFYNRETLRIEGEAVNPVCFGISAIAKSRSAIISDTLSIQRIGNTSNQRVFYGVL